MTTTTATMNAVIVEDDCVVIYDDLAQQVIFDVLSESTTNSDAFTSQFEIVPGTFLAQPEESFRHGTDVMALIRRKSDGRLFGYPYWKAGYKHGDDVVEANGDAYGYEFEPDDDFDWDIDYYPVAYVWLPVEPFTITGYRTVQVNG